MIGGLTDQYTEAKQLLTTAGHPCIICELTGLDMNKYNKMTTDYYIHQKVINEVIPILNRTTYAMNHDDAMPTPFLQDSIHHKANKSDARRKTK